jgi:hypothetical protein
MNDYFLQGLVKNQSLLDFMNKIVILNLLVKLWMRINIVGLLLYKNLAHLMKPMVNWNGIPVEFNPCISVNIIIIIKMGVMLIYEKHLKLYTSRKNKLLEKYSFIQDT